VRHPVYACASVQEFLFKGSVLYLRFYIIFNRFLGELYEEVKAKDKVLSVRACKESRGYSAMPLTPNLGCSKILAIPKDRLMN
jgi:hypothetical protein